MSIWTKLALPSGLCSLTLLFVVLSIRAGIVDQRGSALGVNIAGRQRMLNQRTHKEALRNLHGGEHDVEKTIALLEKSARALRDGGKTPLGLNKEAQLSGSSNNAERALLDDQIALIADLRTTVAELGASDDEAQALLAFEDLTKRFHKTANELVLAMQRRSESQLDSLIMRALALSLIAIAAGVAFTFVTLRSMGQAFADVRNAARRLAKGDLNFDLAGRANDTIGRMANDLGEAIAGIREGLGQDQVTWSEVASDRETEAIVRNATLSQAPGGIVQADWQGSIEFANAAADRLLSRAGVIQGSTVRPGSSLQTIFMATGVPEDAFSPSTRESSKYALLHDEVCLDLRIMPILDEDGDPLGRLVTIEDTTERAQRETEAKEAMERERGEREKLSASVQEILAVVAQARQGDLSARTGWKGDTPVTQVGQEVDALLEAFEENMVQLAGEVETLREAAGSMDASSGQLGQSAERTASKASEAFEASETTAHNTGATAAGLSQVTQSIREIATSASRAAAISKEAVQAAAESGNLMQSLGDRSQEIDDVVKVIKSIAGQTNLLALNATIEAARAGESGKGFAVVANEVKSLATETAQATQQINDRIEGIKVDIGRAIESNSNIQAVIESIDEIQVSIASSVEEQTATAEDMSRQVEDAAASTETIRSALEFVASQASLTATSSKESMEAARHMDDMSQKLEAIVLRYGKMS
ncbi:MAG: methyl-accepting chemotaxis protein [Planctomycetota bacterium]